MSGTRDHGGNLAEAAARHGGAAEHWLDLSTGINRRPWPMPAPPEAVFRALPGAELFAAAEAAARAAWSVHSETAILPLAGAQAAIQLVPRLAPPGLAAILSPTYNEHAAAFAAEGWRVETPTDPAALAGADAAVVVNPNNPDGRIHAPEALEALADRVGLLVVDESFADPTPERSLVPRPARAGLVALRSFGKFHGLAGLRLGFALGTPATVARLKEMAGPWSVSGPALWVGARALEDRGWAAAMREQLARDAARMDALAAGAGWRLAGGTALFRTYETPDAHAAREALARARIWSRAFPWSPTWLRLGLPGPEPEWARLAAAMAAMAGP
ncbi:MAG: threonine-phosphate decarboxylase CobD [Pseudomonadota bacterium]|nr:threonine-phosphate decarboxylase CobD [Pseudomonadota bacterium]